MQFLHYGDRHVATRITGPRHNFLALTFTEKSPEDGIQIVKLPAQGGCEHRELDEAEILASVTAGVADAEEAVRRVFQVQAIEYVANDTGPEDVYRMMAKALVEASHEDAEKKSKDFQKQFGNGRKT